ncbi:hypothetical protein ACIO1C_17900 [Streptomyces sp. NPDC087420]|uniref:DUF7224 domain-containing protein n=1 Tax=Streptomyces sp. NPDC087420 TaxID=3365785 RepID=UPI003832FA41
MKLSTSLRAGSVRWAAPGVILLTLFYYVSNGSTPPPESSGYAPALIASPLMSLYPLAYAVPAALATWESGRLKTTGVWALAPARSRYRVAANALLPVCLLAWTVVILPSVITLVQHTTLPTPSSLLLPAMAMFLCTAHAVIGFSVGLRTPHIITAPVMAVGVWVMVAFSQATEPLWVSNIFGQYTDLMFGEIPKLISLVPHLLFGGSIAAGIALMWLPVRRRAIRTSLACLVAVAGTYTACDMARPWGPNPPLLGGQAPVSCQGHAPQVCMPRATSADELASVRQDVVSALAKLRAVGVTDPPDRITDRLGDGRYSQPSTEKHWRLSLTSASGNRTVAYAVAVGAIRFPCAQVDQITGRAVLLWASTIVGAEKTYDRITASRSDPTDPTDREAKVRSIVREVRSEPTAQQTAWFRQNRTAACPQAR